MDRNTLLDLIPAYAIGALDPDERAEVEAFLAADAEARDMLAEYQAVSDSLILTTPALRAPSHLNTDLRQRLAASRPASTAPAPAPAQPTSPPPAPPPIRVVTPVARTSNWIPYAVAAAAIAVILAAVVLLRPQTPPSDPAQRYAWIVAQADAQRIPLNPADPNPDTAGELVMTADGQYGVIEVWGLPAIQADQTFQLWLVDEGGARSGGLLEFTQPEGPNYISLPLEKSAHDYAGFGVSIEPEGGSPDPNGPTGDRVFGVNPQV